MANTIFVNGEKYYNEKFMASLEKIFFDYFHIVLHRKDIEIKGKLCFICGNPFKQKDLTKHHAIPKKLKSLFNVHIPFCKECHLKFNKVVGEN